MKKIIAFALVSALSISGASASYKEISCSSDPVFGQNSCTQCFDWGSVEQGKDLGLLTDIWSNGTSKSMYMLKEENPLDSAAKMISLNGAAWSYEPQKDGFWEYTDSLEKLAKDGFYELPAWKSVDWIQSKLGYSIKLNKSAEAWKNIWLLKYVINIHTDENWAPSEKTVSHSECVLFKSAGKAQKPTEQKKQQPQKLTKTWPEEVLLLLLSLFLAGSIFYFSRKKV